MDNDGFTLVELIVVISLLALMGVMIGTNMVSVRSKQQQKNYDNYKKDLVADGYLDEDLQYPTGARTGEKVAIYYVDGVKNCSYRG